MMTWLKEVFVYVVGVSTWRPPFADWSRRECFRAADLRSTDRCNIMREIIRSPQELEPITATERRELALEELPDFRARLKVGPTPSQLMRATGRFVADVRPADCTLVPCARCGFCWARVRRPPRVSVPTP